MSEGTNSTSVTAEDIAALSAYIFDLDGVIWRGGEPVEGAVEAVQRLRAAGKRILYCTNNSSREPGDYAQRLRGMGLELDDEEVLTSSWATAVYLSAQFTGPFSVFVVGEAGLVNALQKAGARVVPEHDVDDDTRVDCVVVGIDRSFNYQRLTLAQQLILRGAQFVATNRDATFPIEDGKVTPGSGSIVAAVEAASGVTPVTIGKPRPAIVQLALERFGLKAEETAMVGDRLDTDIAAARNAGIWALFVATGVNTPEQARKSKGQQRPHAMFPNLTALCQIALKDSTLTTPVPAAAATETVEEAEAPIEGTPVAETVVAEPVVAESQAEEIVSVTAPKTDVVAPESTQTESTQTESTQNADNTPYPASSFSFAEPELTPDATTATTSLDEPPSTAAEEASGQIDEDMAAASDIPAATTLASATEAAQTTIPAETTPGVDVDLSELEGIDWGAEAEASSAQAEASGAQAEASGAQAEAMPAGNDATEKTEAGAKPAENPNDPFASWFEPADDKKS